MTSSYENRSYEPLTLEAVFGDQLLDICLEKSPPGEASPCVIASVNDDAHCAKYASLFAAAPQMLGALRLVWNSIDRVNHPAADAVRAALEQAEGKQ